jgi:hypothetical protein
MVGLGLDNCQPSRLIHLRSQQHNGTLSGRHDGVYREQLRNLIEISVANCNDMWHCGRDYPQLRDLIEISVHQLQGSGTNRAHNCQRKCRMNIRKKEVMELVLFYEGRDGDLYTPAADTYLLLPVQLVVDMS